MRLDALPEPTRELFGYAATCDELSTFTLVGGTALAAQIGHRISHDLDFAVFDEKLPTRSIDLWLNRVRDAGLAANDITNPNVASEFRINTGLRLQDYARDYEIAGVKVTFFAHGATEAQRRYYRNADALRSTARSFGILGIEALKTAKTLVLADRARSRDLFDIMVLMRDHNLTVAEQVHHIRTLGQNNDINHYFAVMTGMMPLDRDDEGLQPIGAFVSIDAIYTFLAERIDAWQMDQAESAFRKAKPPPGGSPTKD